MIVAVVCDEFEYGIMSMLKVQIIFFESKPQASIAPLEGRAYCYNGRALFFSMARYYGTMHAYLRHLMLIIPSFNSSISSNCLGQDPFLAPRKQHRVERV